MEIEAAVQKRLPHEPEYGRKRDGFFALIRRKSADVRRRYEDPEELKAMHQKLHNVMNGFTVSGPLVFNVPRLKSCQCKYRYPLYSALN
jgi:hypothetical protein